MNCIFYVLSNELTDLDKIVIDPVTFICATKLLATKSIVHLNSYIYQYVAPGNQTHDLGVANTVFYQKTNYGHMFRFSS